MSECEYYNECANKNTNKETPVKEQAELCYVCGTVANISGEAKPNSPKKETECRKSVLLKATLDILIQCNEGSYVKNALEQTAEWDGAVCDGYCLMDDIKSELGLDI